MIIRTFTDWRDRPLAVGDRVASTGGDGVPGWADAGTVAGFGTARVRVQWDGYRYGKSTRWHDVATAAPTAAGRRKAPALRQLDPVAI